MKKYLLGIVAIALGIGFSAFTLKPNAESTNKEDTYVWHKYNAAGTAELPGPVTFTGTATEAKSAFSCPNGSAVNCARAYDAMGALNIFVKKTAE